MKFKGGDKARVLYDGFPEKYPYGSVVQISHIDEYGGLWTSGGCGFSPTDLEKAGESDQEYTVSSVNPEQIAVDGYESLRDVLDRAFDQAAKGKGAERHADGRAFDRQPMQDLIRLYGVGFALGQAAKKAQESQRMKEPERKVKELLGAIVYIAGAIISIEGEAY